MTKINAMVSMVSVDEKPEHRTEIYKKMARSAQRDDFMSYDVKTLLKLIITGHPFYGCYLKPDPSKELTPSQQFKANWLYVLDFDEGISLKDGLEITRFVENYTPLFWYTTFSHTKNKNKFRIIYRCDNPLLSRDEHKIHYKRLNSYYDNTADKRCLYPEKLFQGTSKKALYGVF